MNSLDALKRMVDHYKGGREAVALRLGKSDEVLRKELDGHPKFKMGVIDALAITAMCTEAKTEHAAAFANVAAAAAGGHVTMLPDCEAKGHDLIQCASVMVHETSDVMTAVAKSIGDGNVCMNDVRAIQREAMEALSAIQAVLHSAHAAYEAGKPKAVDAGNPVSLNVRAAA